MWFSTLARPASTAASVGAVVARERVVASLSSTSSVLLLKHLLLFGVRGGGDMLLDRLEGIVMFRMRDLET